MQGIATENTWMRDEAGVEGDTEGFVSYARRVK